MERVNYVRREGYVTIRNPEAVPMEWGDAVFDQFHWTGSDAAFKAIRAMNPEVEFVDVSGGAPNAPGAPE